MSVARQPDQFEPSDELLVARIRERDPAALEALYDRYGRAAFALGYRMLGDRESAEEVVQDAFMSVWRQAATYDARVGRVRPWLLAVVHHRAIDRLRRLRDRRPATSLDEAWMLASGADVFRDVYHGLQQHQIRRALAALPPDQHAAIELAYFDGYTFAEVAEMTGVPVGTAKSRVRLGLARLRALLDKEVAP